MRLRYLRVANLPPLQNVSIGFGAQSVLERAYALHFVVGVNGSGKTRLLQALAQIFLTLERQQLPDFPCTLAYDLGKGREARTILLHIPDPEVSEGVPSAFIEFEEVLEARTLAEWTRLTTANWRANPPIQTPRRSTFFGGDLPGGGAIGAYLPTVLLTYTSGTMPAWQALFTRFHRDTTTAALPERIIDDEEDTGERPLGWTIHQENQQRLSEYLRELRSRLARNEEVRLTNNDLGLLEAIQNATEATSTSSIAYLVDADMLPLIVCAVTLQQMVIEFQGGMTKDHLQTQITSTYEDGTSMPGLRRLLNAIDWLWPESLQLRIRFTPNQWRPEVTGEIAQLYELATAAIRQPEPSNERLLCFDLFHPLKDRANQLTGSALYEMLAQKYGSAAFAAFRQLVEWRNAGILVEVTMTVRKGGVEDLLLYDWLSDGERMFLGRMALLHLLKDQDDALVILDEPETHFNDVWKREIVDIIDDNLRYDASEVVISTHSSIALSDVFNEEIVLLKRRDGSTDIGFVTLPTFGADPSEIMIQVFGASDSIGQRALENLNKFLEHDWNPEQKEELEKLIREIGPGYYRSELRTKWRALGAPQDSTSGM